MNIYNLSTNSNNYIDKENEKSFQNNKIINPNRASQVYLNIYSNNDDPLVLGFRENDYIFLSVLIDVYGETIDIQHPIGLEIFLKHPDPSLKSDVGFGSSRRECYSKKLKRSIQIGKWLNKNHPDENYYINESRKIFALFIKSNVNNKSSLINSFSFCKFFIENIGMSGNKLLFPNDIKMPPSIGIFLK